MSKQKTYSQEVIADAISYLRNIGINPVERTTGYSITRRVCYPKPGTGKDYEGTRVDKYTPCSLVQMAVNKGFNAPKTGSEWDG